MSILFALIPLSLVLVIAAGWAFFWAVDTRQFDDLDSPAWDILRDDAHRNDGGDEGEDDGQQR